MRPRDRVLDVYGSFVRDDDGWIAAGDLITLMGELGVNSQAVRSAVSRMKRSGLLVAERVDRRAGYALSARGAEILEDGDRRIFGTGHDRESERWVLALFSVPEADRKKRYLIRSCLAQLGFAPGPASSWVAPEDLVDEARHMLEREGLGDYVTLFVGAPSPPHSDPGNPIGAWDLDEIEKMYTDYLDVFDPVAANWLASPGADGEAFVHFMANISAWRPLPYRDPGLPQSVTGDDWPGERARRLFMTLLTQLRPGASRFYRSVVA